jgi:uroporphyrinogen decarboxylase
MKMLTTHQRMTRVYQHREPDRVPITDGPWESTLVRWRREGLPEDGAQSGYTFLRNKEKIQ